MTYLKIADFNDFVMMAGDQIVTDSRKVAGRFDKQHRDVLRKIRDLIKRTGEWGARNFTQCFENNELANGKPEPLYSMTKDGFMLLAMGFTGKKALETKLSFIAAFNAMAEHIKRQASSAWAEYRAAAIEFAKCQDTASLCGKGLNRWRMVKPTLHARLISLEGKMQMPLQLE